MIWHDMLIEQKEKLNKLKLLQVLRHEQGAILIFTAIAISTLLGMVGLAYDVGNLYMHKARLQNVADSAALAGARAYINSQENTPKDSIDTSTSPKTEESYALSDTAQNKPHTGTPHPNADAAADNYIYKNIINLGNTVNTDSYSHFALLSDEENPKTFYRVGLYEYVDLYFLPVIKGIGKKQKVAVEAIAVLEENNGGDIPATIFDTLYTFSNYLNVKQGTMTNPDTASLGKKPSEGGSKIRMTFDGKMIYTGEGENGFYNLEGNVQHLYTTEGQQQQQSQNLSATEMGTSYTNDPQKTNTSFALSGYATIINDNLLARPHIELNMDTNDANNFTVHNINDLSSSLYSQQETFPDGSGIYVYTYTDRFGTENEFKYAENKDLNDYNSSDKYYSYDEHNNKMYFIVTNNIRVLAYKGTNGFTDDKGIQYEGNYVFDGNNKRIYFHVDNNDVYFANEAHHQILKTGKMETHCKYTDENNNSILINYVATDYNKLINNTNDAHKRISQVNTNIFHFASGNINKTLEFNDEITGGGEPSEPLYIINDANQKLEISVTKSNVRPIVIIHNGTNKVIVKVTNGAVFNAVIYAPYVSEGGEEGVKLELTSSHFKGNIVAQNISVSNNGPSSFTQVNHLKERDANLYNDIFSYASQNGQLLSESSDNNKPPTNSYNTAWQEWYNLVGSETASNWFNNLSRSQQVAFWRSWDSLKRPKNSDAGIRNKWYSTDWKKTEYGWPFQNWNPTEQEIEDAKNDVPVESVFETKLRLINPRLELNPFTKTSS